MKISLFNTIRYIKIFWIKHQTKRRSLLELNFRHPIIIAPHPDDEVLGCGGLIARFIDRGIFPHVIIMTRGEASHCGCCNTSSEDIIKARRQLVFQASHILGLPETHIHCLNYADGGISPENTVETDRLRKILDELPYDAVFVPHWGEGWSDHLQTAEIAKSLIRKHAELYEYCVWMWYYNVWGLDWNKACQLSMTGKEHALKKKAVDTYVLPKAPCGTPWSGNLPNLLIKSCLWNKELFFRIR